MKLISINIEGNKHFERVLPFVEKENPDTLCLQEIFELDLPKFEAMGYVCAFLPETKKLIDSVYCNQGIALCTRGEMQNVKSFYYRNEENPLRDFNAEKRIQSINEIKRGVLCIDALCNDGLFKIATTHFTWTPRGEAPSNEQALDVETFLKKVEGLEPHIICGDFNIPRGMSPLYAKLIKQYTDCIPLKYSSSLDANLHHLGNMVDKKVIFDSFMVDYLFTQHPYIASDVRLEFGLSDHAAVVGVLNKETP